MERDDEVRDVMAEEKSRGKRKYDAAARKARPKMLRDVGYLLRLENRQEFAQNLIRLGLTPGSPAFELALRAWNEKREA